MRIAICDDRPELIAQIRQYVQEYLTQQGADSNVIDTYYTGTALLASDQPYDVVFLDVELGDINGIDAARELMKRHKNIAVIIVTAHRGYLDEAMDIRAIRFLDKPVEKARVFSALKRAEEEAANSTLTLHTKENGLLSVRKSELIYAEARLRYSLVVTVQGAFLVKEGIRHLQELLSASPFAVPHNSYLVNMNYIRMFRREELQLCCQQQRYAVPVSLRRQAAFKKEYIRFIGEES